MPQMLPNSQLDEEDPDILMGEYNFSQEFFNLEETQISIPNINVTLPHEKVINSFKPFNNHLKIAHLNARSIPRHIDEITNLLVETRLDVLAVSETWLYPNANSCLYNIKGYNILRHDRINKRGGGVCIYSRNDLNTKIIPISYEFDQPEMLAVELTNGTNKIAIAVLYKPPNIPYGVFATMHESLAHILCNFDNVVMLGDLNIDLMKPETCAAKFLVNNVFEPFSLTQLVTTPTRITESSAKILDLIMVSNQNQVKMVNSCDLPGISDHSLIFMAYVFKRSKNKTKPIWRRDFRQFSIDRFNEDLVKANWENVYIFEELDTENKVTVFNNIITELFDKHAPYKQFRPKFGRTPWLTEEIKKIMDDRDTFKIIFNRDRNNVEALNNYKELKNRVNNEIRKSKIKTFNKKINSNITNTKDFWLGAEMLGIHDTKKSRHSCTLSPDALNDTFVSNNNASSNNQFIKNEINKILMMPKMDPVSDFQFKHVTELEVEKIIKSLRLTSGGHDDINAKMLKLTLPYCVIPVTDIINSSFSTSFFPNQWKKAVVIPIPKILNPNSTNDFRPISLLPTLSKIAEKIAAKQMIEFLTINNLMEPLQSGFKSGYSTATALLKITDDIFSSIDAGEVTFLVLLDYSKAFDTVNHELLLAKLKVLGFTEGALNWLLSYLSNRLQKVKVNGEFSEWKHVINGVPQGSILGPLLFTILVMDIGKCVKNGKFHQYADDTQLYYSAKVDKIDETIGYINSDLENINTYSSSNGLRLNHSKSHYIIIGSRANIIKVDKKNIPPITISNNAINRLKEVKNLGIYFDESMSWVRNINKTICKAYASLRALYRLKRFLSIESKTILCESLVLSHFNYCDYLFFNLTTVLCSKIQKVQNSCIRFIFNLRKYDRHHITPYLSKLGWLNMKNRRMLHSLVLMFKIDKNIAPSYLINAVNRVKSAHEYNLRTANNFRTIKCRQTNRQNTFFAMIPPLYNNLPANCKNCNTISMFKTQCKAHLNLQQS